MKHNNSARRNRGRTSNRSNTSSNNQPARQNGDHNRNENRMRGNPGQLLEKYKSLAREALTAGDRVLAEHYFQHADHYLRMSNERGSPRPQDAAGDQYDGPNANIVEYEAENNPGNISEGDHDANNGYASHKQHTPEAIALATDLASDDEEEGDVEAEVAAALASSHKAAAQNTQPRTPRNENPRSERDGGFGNSGPNFLRRRRSRARKQGGEQPGNQGAGPATPKTE
jgi:hypothetical protein